jgi:galactokinase
MRSRARHAVTENLRVYEAVAALGTGDMRAFGRLMDESHASMRDDFAIVPEAMDAMTARARAEGALGSRLTGGGFGGCFVSCVPAERLAEWLAAMAEAFPETWVVSEGLTSA